MLKIEKKMNAVLLLGLSMTIINFIEIECLKCCLNNVHKHFVLANKINKLCMD